MMGAHSTFTYRCESSMNAGNTIWIANSQISVKRIFPILLRLVRFPSNIHYIPESSNTIGLA